MNRVNNPTLSLASKLRDVYAHPVGRDVVNKLLLQLNKPAWLVTNPIIGNLTLEHLKNLAGKRINPGFFDAILTLLNSEKDSPSKSHIEAVPIWWKEAVFYQIYPRSFSDSNRDGIGDLQGIVSRLDTLCALGVDAIWLSPVYDSPNDDNGYDIRDYYGILSEFGSMADMDELISAVHSRGMKLIMDLVVNHTSDEHPWFQSALNDENSPYRDFYFFRKSNGKPPNNWTSFFSGSAWNYYAEQDIWALHLFSKKQMDLNWECPALREEIYKMIRWWLEKGVDGFRLDVINYISKPDGLPDGNNLIGSLMGYTGVERYFYGPRLHEHIRELRAEAFEPYGAFSVGETPGIGLQTGRLLTDGYRRELDLIFAFDHLETPGHTRFDEYEYDLRYLKRYYTSNLNADLGHGWNTLFFNNHDNPRMISKIDPSGFYSEVLAKLLAVMQLTLRGTPFIYQGDETGTVNIQFKSISELKDVESINLYDDLVKTMSPAAAFKHVLAGTRDHARAMVGWDVIEKQRGDSGSVWNFYKSLIALRRSSKAFIYGQLEFLHAGKKDILCYTRERDGELFFVEINLTAIGQKSVHPAGTKLLLCNYPGEQIMLRPYEARVYEIRV